MASAGVKTSGLILREERSLDGSEQETDVIWIALPQARRVRCVGSRLVRRGQGTGHKWGAFRSGRRKGMEAVWW